MNRQQRLNTLNEAACLLIVLSTPGDTPAHHEALARVGPTLERLGRMEAAEPEIHRSRPAAHD